jgi:hypothetical protein
VGNRIYDAKDFYEKLGGEDVEGNHLSVDTAANYSLANNIDLTEFTDLAGNPIPWRGPAGYSGHLFGNGYTIRGLVLDEATTAVVAGGSGKSVGLFASLENGAVVENFTLEVSTPNNQISDLSGGGLYFGGMLAIVDNSAAEITIQDVKVKGDLKLKKTAITPGTTDTFLVCGGFIGEARRYKSITINRCASEVSLTLTSNSGVNAADALFDIGGFVGRHWRGSNNSVLSFTDCYASGNLSAELEYTAAEPTGTYATILGGFIGDICKDFNEVTTVTFNRCYASGNIEGKDLTGLEYGKYYEGGFVGGVAFKANSRVSPAMVFTMENCAAVGVKTIQNPLQIAEDTNGRVAGFVRSTVGTMTLANNIANSGMLVGTGTIYTGPDGADTKQGLGKSIAELKTQSTWTSGLGWSADTWDFSGLQQGKWPTLR